MNDRYVICLGYRASLVKKVTERGQTVYHYYKI